MAERFELSFTPRLWPFLRRQLPIIFLVTVVSYLYQGYVDKIWWSFEYVISLSIPISLFLLLIWLASVPVRMEMSQQNLVIRYRCRPLQEFKWDDLRFWDPNVDWALVLEFADKKRLTIVAFAYPQPQREALMNFLKKRFPELKARGWLFDRMYR